MTATASAEPAGAVAALHEVGRRDVPVPVRDRPEPRQEHEDDRVDHDRVRHGEEAGHRAGREHRRRHRDEGVRRVEVAAEQEPGDEGAEAAAAEAPLVEAVHARRPPPPGRGEAHHGDEDEQDDDDGQRDPVDAGHRSSPPRRALCDQHVGQVGAAGRDEHPQQLVPVEEREAPQPRRRPSRSCPPTSAPRSAPGPAPRPPAIIAGRERSVRPGRARLSICPVRLGHFDLPSSRRDPTPCGRHVTTPAADHSADARARRWSWCAGRRQGRMPGPATSVGDRTGTGKQSGNAGCSEQAEAAS